MMIIFDSGRNQILAQWRKPHHGIGRQEIAAFSIREIQFRSVSTTNHARRFRSKSLDKQNNVSAAKSSNLFQVKWRCRLRRACMCLSATPSRAQRCTLAPCGLLRELMPESWLGRLKNWQALVSGLAFLSLLQSLVVSYSSRSRNSAVLIRPSECL
jgi:hypothetical protein